jgi:hypothetical protein
VCALRLSGSIPLARGLRLRSTLGQPDAHAIGPIGVVRKRLGWNNAVDCGP